MFSKGESAACIPRHGPLNCQYKIFWEYLTEVLSVC